VTTPDPTEQPDLVELAKGIVDSNAYMTIATADSAGTPWATPVWFAHHAYADFLWVSRPETRHSRNLADRPAVAIAIFDSTVPVGSAQAVYVEAVAAEVTGPDVDAAIEAYSRRSAHHGAGVWSAAEVTDGAPFRLFRARATEFFVLDEQERRVPVELGPRISRS